MDLNELQALDEQPEATTNRRGTSTTPRRGIADHVAKVPLSIGARRFKRRAR